MAAEDTGFDLQQAADTLNVSPEYVQGLLESGEIEWRPGYPGTGAGVMIPRAELMRYQARSDDECQAAAGELTALGQEMGLI